MENLFVVAFVVTVIAGLSSLVFIVMCLFSPSLRKDFLADWNKTKGDL